MRTEYNSGSIVVNNFVCLTDNNQSPTFTRMNFGERLAAARNYAKLTQAELSEKLGTDKDGKLLMTQSNISALERDPKTKGSLHSVKLARACGVSPDWLAYEEGEMVAECQAAEPWKENAIDLLSQLPPGLRAEQIRGIYSLAEFLREHKPKNDAQQ